MAQKYAENIVMGSTEHNSIRVVRQYYGRRIIVHGKYMHGAKEWSIVAVVDGVGHDRRVVTDAQLFSEINAMIGLLLRP